MNNEKTQLKLGNLKITLHRTIRVNTSKEGMSSLPPSLGYFEIYKVSDYRKTCPVTWEDNAFFIPMHEEEAMWINFDNTGEYPVALLIGAGGINALTGEKLKLELKKDNYLVTPPQPWLDGWKNSEGSVYQFVATEYQYGEGKSVSEQILKEESITGGIGLALFEAKEPEKLKKINRPSEFAGYPGDDKSSCMQISCGSANLDEYDLEYAAAYPIDELPKEMGIGKGGKIEQKIYEDENDVEVWKTEPSITVAVYLINGAQFSKITGKPMPPLPKSFNEYGGLWWDLEDKNIKDVEGTKKFDDLKNVFQ